MDSYFFVDPSALTEAIPSPDAPPWVIAPGRHDKATLVPWGEYTPGGSWCPPLEKVRGAISIIPELTAGPGDEPPFVLATLPPSSPGFANREVRAGTIICFEIAFPTRCRAWRNRGANVLVNPANYAWYGDTGMPAQVLALGKLRAAELSVAVIIAGNSGPTAILDPAGRVTAQVERDGKTQFVEGYLAGPLLVDPDYRTLYAIVGDVPWLGLGALLFGLALRRKRPGRGGERAAAGTAPASRDTPVTEENGASTPVRPPDEPASGADLRGGVTP
jgi:apolipoprotein N-acyltransferase